MSKKEELIKQIESFDGRWFNEDQKSIAISILQRAPEKEANAVFDFVKFKRRTGFAFDYSPEIAKGRIIVPELYKRLKSNVVPSETNKLIIGDNYNALKVLNLTHKEAIDIIYIDPPYNTDKMKTDGNQSSKEMEGSKKFVYKDKFGRTGWLNMLRDRLILAKELLTPNGVIFASIDDIEQAYLRVLMDEVFGEENFISTLSWLKGNAQNDANNYQRNHEYIHCFSKNKTKTTIGKAIKKIEGKGKLTSLTTGNDNTFVKKPNLGQTVYFNQETKDIKIVQDYDPNNIELIKTNDEDLIYQTDMNLINDGYIAIRPPKVKVDGKIVLGRWSIQTSTMIERSHLLVPVKNKGNWTVKQIDERTESSNARKSFIEEPHLRFGQGSSLLNSIGLSFDNPKPINLLMELISHVSGNDNAVVLDFFAGSGSLGHAIMEMNRNDNGNRKFILVTNNENDIAYDKTLERMHRIILGKDSNGNSEFDWIKKNKPYSNENLDVFSINDKVKINIDQSNLDELEKEILVQLKNINEKYEPKDLDLYYQLSALNPLSEDE